MKPSRLRAIIVLIGLLIFMIIILWTSIVELGLWPAATVGLVGGILSEFMTFFGPASQESASQQRTLQMASILSRAVVEFDEEVVKRQERLVEQLEKDERASRSAKNEVALIHAQDELEDSKETLTNLRELVSPQSEESESSPRKKERWRERLFNVQSGVAIALSGLIIDHNWSHIAETASSWIHHIHP